jgi:hypothetical protein
MTSHLLLMLQSVQLNNNELATRNKLSSLHHFPLASACGNDTMEFGAAPRRRE